MKRASIINILLTSGGVTALVVVVGGLIWSHNEAQSYTDRMQQSTAKLETQFRLLENSTTRSILDDPDAPVEVQKKDTHTIKQTIAKSRAAIEDLHKTSATIDEHFYIGVSNANKRAPVLQTESQTLVTQSRDALEHYERTLEFLEAYTLARHKIQSHIDSFNQQTDLNAYTGKGEEIRAAATSIREQFHTFSVKSGPHELSELREQSIAIMNKVADGFDLLAYGIDIAVDSTIYEAAAIIEAANGELDALTQKSYGTVIQNSRAIKDIGELTEKLDPLEVAETSRF